MVKSQQASAILQKLFVILHLLVDSLFLYINKGGCVVIKFLRRSLFFSALRFWYFSCD